MAVITWDETGDRLFEAGIDHGVLYPMTNNGYGNGVAWNGLTSVSISSDGGEPNDLYADNIQYASIMSNEKINFSIEAYTSPVEFDACDGSVSPVAGMTIGQQSRKQFGFVCRTKIGNDVDDLDHGYKIHIFYGCKASPAERSYETINDSPDAMTLSWDCITTPVAVEGMEDVYRPTAHIVIDSTKFTTGTSGTISKLRTLEGKLFGTDSTEPTLPSPAQIITDLT